MNISRLFKKKKTTQSNSPSKYDVIHQRFIEQNLSFLFSLQENGKTGIEFEQSNLDNIIDISKNLINYREIELESTINNAIIQLPELKKELEQTHDYFESRKFDLNKHDTSFQKSFFTIFRLYKTIKRR